MPARKRTTSKKDGPASPKISRFHRHPQEPGEGKTTRVADPTASKRLTEKYAWIVEKWRRHFNHKRRTTSPHRLAPMLASTTSQPFDDPTWQFEIKWDGYRCLAYLSAGKTDLRSRNQLSLNKRFPELAEELQSWPINAVVDGEIVVLTEEGRADFGALQQWSTAKTGQLVYYVFDLLWLDGIDLQQEPLTTRREVLKSLVPEGGRIRFSEAIDECGVAFYEAAKQNSLEGIIAKQKNAPYRSGDRSKNWYKIKIEQRHEAIICGYTLKQGTDRVFSSLLLGLPEDKGIKYIGAVGTGFSQAVQEQILRKLAPLTTNKAPFKKPPSLPGFVQWVRPLLVCEVKFTERTKDGLMRHPSFQGLRDDKSIGELNPEFDHEQTTVAEGRTDKKADRRDLILEGQQVTLTNLRKLYWPREKITKGDLLDYYQTIAPYILPYLLNRPQSLNRFPNGVNGESFYQKNMRGKVEPWLKTFSRSSENTAESKDFLVCTGAASMLYMVNLGCIELNPWHSRVQAPHYPDWCILDLDPGAISFNAVIETAQVIHQLLQSLGVDSFPKTSGATGLHIYIPLGGKYNYEQSRQLAELLATLVHQELPKTTSLLRKPEKRADKIYIDFLQNRPIQTICAPYSVRPQPGATVSAPLHWTEVTKGLRIQQFTMATMVNRVRQEGDLFQGVLCAGIDLNSVLKTLSSVLLSQRA